MWLILSPVSDSTAWIVSFGPPQAQAALIFRVAAGREVDERVARDRELARDAAADAPDHQRVGAGVRLVVVGAAPPWSCSRSCGRPSSPTTRTLLGENSIGPPLVSASSVALAARQVAAGGADEEQHRRQHDPEDAEQHEVLEQLQRVPERAQRRPRNRGSAQRPRGRAAPSPRRPPPRGGRGGCLRDSCPPAPRARRRSHRAGASPGCAESSGRRCRALLADAATACDRRRSGPRRRDRCRVPGASAAARPGAVGRWPRIVVVFVEVGHCFGGAES